MADQLSREYQIIKNFIEGKPVAPAQATSIMGRVRANPSAEKSEGRLGFGLSSETMEKLEKRREQDKPRVRVRAASDEESAPVTEQVKKVDREALRRDILGADRFRKFNATTQYQSVAGKNKPYVRKSDPSSFVPRHARQ
jgi:hypothetical protein